MRILVDGREVEDVPAQQWLEYGAARGGERQPQEQDLRPGQAGGGEWAPLQCAEDQGAVAGEAEQAAGERDRPAGREERLEWHACAQVGRAGAGQSPVGEWAGGVEAGVEYGEGQVAQE